MKEKRKKVVSVLLSLCMVMGMMQPVIASAERETKAKKKGMKITTMNTYLSDLEWVSQTCGAASDYPNGTAKDTNIDGKEIVLLLDGKAQTFDKGLGIHAPSSVSYNIAGRGYTNFEAYVGVDYSRTDDYYAGEAVIGNFTVKIDGEIVAQSGRMDPTMDAHHFNVAIPEHAKIITLETDSGPRYDWADWGNWADAKLLAELGDPENLALNKSVTVKRTTDEADANVNTDRPAVMAVDGIKNNSAANYCDFGRDGVDESLYLQIDLGKQSLIEQVNLWRYWLDGRTYKGTVIAISENSSFENPTIIFNSDAENFHGFGAGTDALYAESEAGKEFMLTDMAQGRFLRVYMHGVNGGGTTNHVVEVEAIGYEIEGEPIPAERVELRIPRVSYQEGTTIKVGRKAYLEAELLPLETTDEIVSYESSDTGIAVVDENGTVTGIGEGTAVITATTTSGASGTIDIHVRAKKEKGTIRHIIDAEHPLYLENYYWSDDFANKNSVSGNVPQEQRVDSPVTLWSTVPDSLKGNTVILLIAERSLNNTDEIRQWIKENVELCNANNIPCAVQAVNGETRMNNPISIEFYEELARNNEMLVGYNAAELYNRFNGSASEYMVDLIQICVENGVQMIWTDTNIFGDDGVLVDWMQENQDLTDIMRENKEYIAMMYKESYGQPNTEALYLGMWLTEYCDNWGIASDWWHWQLDGNGALFDGAGGDAWKQCLTWPEAMYTQDILRAVSQGATCFKSEAQWYSNATKGMRTPGYQYSILPFLEKLANGEYKIPSKEEVEERTKAIVVGRDNWHDFNYEKSFSQLYPSTAKYGIVPFVPLNCPEEALENFDFVITRNFGRDGLKAELDKIYTTDKTGGNAWCETYGDTYYFMNSSEDKNVTQNTIITPQINNSESLEITATPHTYGVIKEEEGRIQISLGNYRIDKTEIWTDSKYAGGFSDMDCYKYVWELCERMENDTNHDKDLRSTVIEVVCDTKPEVVFAAKDEYTRPYEYVENWNEQEHVYTLSLEHNGIVNLDLITEKQVPEKPVDKALLQKAYEYALAQNTDGVADSAVKFFEDAKAAAKAVLDDENAAWEEVEKAWSDLLKGIWGLGIVKGDKEILKILIDKADSMIPNADRYVEAYWSQLTDALAKAKEVYENGDAMQKEVDLAADAFYTAILAQRYKADKSNLEELIKKVEGFSLEGYTAESVQAFKVALAEAMAVMADGTLSENEQQIVDDMVRALVDAADALKKEDDNKTSNDDKTSDDNKASNSGKDTDKKDNSKAPTTGDVLNAVILFLIFAAAGGTVLVIFRKKRMW